MIAPQTFNNYPEFGSQAIKCKPGDAKYSNGFIPGEVFPAEYVNWFFSGATLGVTGAQAGLSSIERELQTLLSCAGKSPDVNCFSQVYDSVQYLIQNNLGNAAACPLGTASAGQSTQAARADHVHELPSYVRDNYSPTQNIYIGYSNTGLTCAQISHIAGYSSSLYEPGKVVIKDIAKNEMQNWLDLGTAAYCPASAFRASDWVPTQVEYSRMTSFLVEGPAYGTSGNGMYITVDAGNELNMHAQNNGTAAWINYRGGVNTVYIGDGDAYSGGYGTVIAKCFCGAFEGNLTGTARDATCASCAENACHAFLLDTGVPGWANFRFVAQEGAPEFIWGANDGLNTRVWRPSCLSVLQSSRVSDGTAKACAECNNEFNLYPAAGTGNAMWLNYRGGAAATCIGNGAGTGGLGDLYASTVHANLAGTASCACDATFAERVGLKRMTNDPEQFDYYFYENGNTCINLGSSALVAIGYGRVQPLMFTAGGRFLLATGCITEPILYLSFW